MDTLVKWVGVGTLAIVLVVLMAGVNAFLILWAWNLVVPSLFGLREINLLEAYALALLSSCLIKSSLRCEHTK